VGVTEEGKMKMKEYTIILSQDSEANGGNWWYEVLDEYHVLYHGFESTYRKALAEVAAVISVDRTGKRH
jgi:hypothetical protein